MKRLLCIIVLTLLSGCAVAPTKSITLVANVLSATRVVLDLGAGKREYIEVEVLGYGVTREAAREDGFRTAVIQGVGAIVLSESEARNQKLVRDEIISYSSGYVDRHEIQTERVTVRGVELKMKVWVAELQIARRLLASSSTAGKIDGKNLSLRVEGVLQERYKGDHVLSIVLADFPHRAFDIKVGKHSVQLNERREVSLQIPFELKWNYDYLASLYEALYAIRSELEFCWSCLLDPKLEDPSRRQRRESMTAFSMTVKPPKNWIMGWSGTLVFDDDFALRAMYQAFIETRPAIKLEIANESGRVVQSECFYYSNLDHQIHHRYPGFFMYNANYNYPQMNRASINGNQVMAGSLPLNFKQDTGRLSALEKVKVSVVRGLECPIR